MPTLTGFERGAEELKVHGDPLVQLTSTTIGSFWAVGPPVGVVAGKAAAGEETVQDTTAVPLIVTVPDAVAA